MVETLAVRTLQRLRKLFPSAAALRWKLSICRILIKLHPWGETHCPILMVIKFHGWTSSLSFPRQFISADVENFMREAMVDSSKFKFPQPPYRLETPLVDVEIDPHMRGLNAYVYQIAFIPESFCTLYHQVERILQTKGCPGDPATKPQKESKP